MIIAKQKKRENVAEYILYMWQVEDLIRAYNFNIEEINADVVRKFDQPEQVKNEIKNWYEGLIDLMREEHIIEKGHLQFVKNTVNDLYNSHLFLIQSPDHLDYIDLYNKAKFGIVELMDKSKGNADNEIEACFNGLYGLLMLRIQRKIISPETTAALSAISKLIALLAKKHKMIEDGDIEL